MPHNVINGGFPLVHLAVTTGKGRNKYLIFTRGKSIA